MQRTAENCRLTKMSGTKPKQIQGKCTGFSTENILCELCQHCTLNINYKISRKLSASKKLSKNDEIRKLAKEKGVKLYMVANYMGISQATLTRKLRYELSEEEKKIYFQAIEQISKMG